MGYSLDDHDYSNREYDALLEENARLRQQLAEQTSADPYAYEIAVDGQKRLHATNGKPIPAFMPKVTVTKLYKQPQYVEVLLEALRKLRQFKFCDGNADHLPIIDNALSSYKPTEG